MSNQPKVSVIVPVYNVEMYLEQCLDSIIHQTLREIEIICVDDGSTDGSVAILKRYAAEDSRFVLLYQENKGGGAARNLGMTVAGGKYVIFLNSDDFFEPALLEKSYEAAESHSADVVLFDARRFNDKKQQVVETSRFLRTDLLPEQEVFSRRDVANDIFRITSPAPWLRLYRSDFLARAGLQYQEISNSNDFYFGLCTLALAERICAVDEPLVYYRVNNVTSTQGKKNKNMGCVFQAIEGVYQELNRRGVYDEVRHSFAHLALSTVIFSLNSVNTDEGRYAVLALLQTDSFREMNLLEHEFDWYENKAAYQYSNTILSAIRQYEKTTALEKPRTDTVVYPYRGEGEIDVSVIIPVFNTSVYLEDTLKSIVEQTLKSIEIICVDDGSTDDSLSRLERWAEQDRRISVYHQENGGLSRTRNVGMSHARGAYLYFMDSDDILDREALECLYQKAEQERLDVLYFDGKSFFENEQLQANHAGFVNNYQRRHCYDGVYQGQALFAELRQNGEYLSSACLQLVRASYLRENHIRFHDGIIHEDNAFTFETILRAARAAHLGSVFFYRRVRDNSIMTANVTFKNCYGYFACYQDMNRLLDELEGQLTAESRSAAVRLIRQMLRNARNCYQQMPAEQRGSEYGLGADYTMFDVLVKEYCNRAIETERLESRCEQMKAQRDEKHQILQRTYAEKSEINAKLQRTYREKSERGVEIKALKSRERRQSAKISALREQLSAERKKNEKLKRSRSYRIGRAITWPLRKLKAVRKGRK